MPFPLPEPQRLVDAFYRQRMSLPITLFDSKQLHDSAPLFWDESITNNSGNATSTHDTTNAETQLYVESGDTIIRQTFTHWNYQPGKSQLAVYTGRVNAPAGFAGVQAEVGSFTATDGIFFRLKGGQISVIVRKASVDFEIRQSEWNKDRLDGSNQEFNPSGRKLDARSGHIFWTDFEWLALGSVRFGFYVDGEPILCHQENHFNNITSAYMSTPNLPVRYQITTTGNPATLQHICSTVISEGSDSPGGVIHSASTKGTACQAAANDGTMYALLGLRLKTTHLDASVRILAATVGCSTSSDVEYFTLVNPTLSSGTVTWANETNSPIQVGRPSGDPGPVLTGGIAEVVPSGVIISGAPNAGATGDSDTPSALFLGSTIGGTAIPVYIAARTYDANADIHAVVHYRALS